jgi:hypothetical protein
MVGRVVITAIIPMTGVVIMEVAAAATAIGIFSARKRLLPIWRSTSSNSRRRPRALRSVLLNSGRLRPNPEYQVIINMGKSHLPLLELDDKSAAITEVLKKYQIDLPV